MLKFLLEDGSSLLIGLSLLAFCVKCHLKFYATVISCCFQCELSYVWVKVFLCNLSQIVIFQPFWPVFSQKIIQDFASNHIFLCKKWKYFPPPQKNAPFWAVEISLTKLQCFIRVEPDKLKIKVKPILQYDYDFQNPNIVIQSRTS